MWKQVISQARDNLNSGTQVSHDHIRDAKHGIERITRSEWRMNEYGITQNKVLKSFNSHDKIM